MPVQAEHQERGRAGAGQLRVTHQQHLGGQETSPPTMAVRTDNQDRGAASNHHLFVLL